MSETLPMPTAAELMKPWTDAYSALMNPWMKVFQNTMPSFPALLPTKKKTDHAANCGCHECKADSCHCRCCIGDADLVVPARAGERRVIPLVIENNQRRERTVNFELSDWTTHGGKTDNAPTTVSLLPKSMTLSTCEERTVTLVIETKLPAIGEANGEGNGTIAEGNNNLIAVNRERFGDVDDCVVYYADLRVTGCDIRPIRIAVAISPRDCDAFVVDCRCGCC